MKNLEITSLTSVGSRVPRSTAKSLLFIDSNLQLAEDNANLNFDDATKILSASNLNLLEGDITNVSDIALDTISADNGSSFAISNNWTNAGNTIADLGIVTTVDINGGTIDGNIIGGSTPANGTFTNIVGTSLDLSFTQGSIWFEGASGVTENNAKFFWDNTDIRLGIGTATPSAMLHIVPETTTVDGLFIKQPASYTGDGINIQDSASTEIFVVNGDGSLATQTTSTAMLDMVNSGGTATTPTLTYSRYNSSGRGIDIVFRGSNGSISSQEAFPLIGEMMSIKNEYWDGAAWIESSSITANRDDVTGRGDSFVFDVEGNQVLTATPVGLIVGPNLPTATANRVTIHDLTSLTNSTTYALNLINNSTGGGSASAGIGVGINFNVSTDVGPGTNQEDVAKIDGIATSVSFGSEEGALLFKTMTSGSAPTEKLRIHTGGLIGINETTPDAMLEIVTNSTTEEGLKVKGSVSQTGALFNLVDSSDNIYITSGDGLTSSEFRGNDQGVDIDFVWEGSTNTELFKVDAGDDKIVIDGDFEVTGQFKGLSLNIVSKTGAYTTTATDDTVLNDSSGGAYTITLPAVASTTTGKVYTIKKTDVSANAVTVDGNGAETIDGLTTQILAAQWDSITIQSNGTSWFII